MTTMHAETLTALTLNSVAGVAPWSLWTYTGFILAWVKSESGPLSLMEVIIENWTEVKRDCWKRMDLDVLWELGLLCKNHCTTLQWLIENVSGFWVSKEDLPYNSRTCWTARGERASLGDWLFLVCNRKMLLPKLSVYPRVLNSLIKHLSQII